jgi:hypothetical protein
MDYFLWGHQKEHVYAVPPKTIEDLMTRIRAFMAAVDANMVRHVQENDLWHTGVFLEMVGGYFKYLF